MKGGRTTSLDSSAMRNDEGSSAVNADRSVRILIDPLDVRLADIQSFGMRITQIVE